MSREDQRKDLGGISSFIKSVKDQIKVRTSRRCHKCQERIAWTDRRPCGEHEVIQLDPSDYVDHDISITLMPSPGPRPNELPAATVQRDATDSRTPVERHYETKPEPQVGQREPYWKEDPEFRPNAPVYRRGASKEIGWHSSAAELNEEMDRRERGTSSDDDYD